MVLYEDSRTCQTSRGPRLYDRISDRLVVVLDEVDGGGERCTQHSMAV